MFSKIQDNIQNNPEARKRRQPMSWLIMIGGFVLAVMGFVTGEHPNPYIVPSLIVIGVDGVLLGLSLLLHLRHSRVVSWLILLVVGLFILFLYLITGAILFK